jgi:hypothetical protein
VDSRIEAFAVAGADDTLQVRDVATGAVTGTVSLPDALRTDGLVSLVHDALLTAQRGPEGITVTAYGRPSLNRSWSLIVPDFTPASDLGGGEVYLGDCPPDSCLMVRGAGFWVINQSTGAITTVPNLQLLARLGGGVFLAAPTRTDSSTDANGGRVNGLVLDAGGRIIARLPATGLVDWSDDAGRSLVTGEGRAGTDLRVIDDRGTVRTIGSVPGIGLTCHAGGDILACSDPAGRLRVWRLPL